jgi:signal transduction histidine kinase
VILSIFQTHRFIGPTVAFRRHIRDLANGEYTKRVTIRRGDAFAEVAYELNRLAHILENREKEKEKEHEKKP